MNKTKLVAVIALTPICAFLAYHIVFASKALGEHVSNEFLVSLNESSGLEMFVGLSAGPILLLALWIWLARRKPESNN